MSFSPQEHIYEAIFPEYSEVPYISKGAKIMVVWKSKSYLEELDTSG